MTLEQQRIDATSMVAKELREREEKQRQEEEQRKVDKLSQSKRKQLLLNGKSQKTQ